MPRKNVTTSIHEELIIRVKHLAVDLRKPINDLIEEALKDLLKKYEKKFKK